MMDICQGSTIGTYYCCLNNLYVAASAVYDQIIFKAVKEEKELILESYPTTNLNNLAVSDDGVWKMKRTQFSLWCSYARW